ncbi:hypothetical protein [Nannocystis bainbridge]|uniref:CR-type domain-containing protein n=1 Tax=Nannocystis bainbridge TaxID=2995303 RepID=A0ABT5E9B3_9BACT|nr:hypothetical protein [Nannocystis bainbridge]MDC0721503.1 hypothetical protein [Nannocystis bainbridge]
MFGAPRALASLISGVENKDEVLHRVLTEIIRRDLREERTTTSERGVTQPSVDPARLDPFAYPAQDLKARTTHVVRCMICRASGTASCSVCSGRASVSCSNCGGAGRFRNPSTNRLNKCKQCKGTGQASCGNCAGRGNVPCTTCNGSGHQRAWLTFVETRRVSVVVQPQSPVALAHRQLTEPRLLRENDVAAFTVAVDRKAPGPLPLADLELDGRSAVQGATAGVDPRLERVAQQHYIQLRVPRRDVSYAMCGTSGVLVLSGHQLVGASTPEAKRPIRRRLFVWPILALFVSVCSAMPSSTTGRSEYFKDAAGATSLLWLGATVLAVLWIGGVLRIWGTGKGFKGLKRVEQVCLGLWAAALLAMAIVGVVARPSAEEIDQALAVGDTRRARVVLAALRETSDQTFVEAEDTILLAEANEAAGEERLKRLDQIAAHGRERSATAATIARAERLTEIRRLVADGHATDAEGAIDRWFAESWRGDPELAEERARAIDSRSSQCTDEPCRLTIARAANAAQGSTARAAAVERAKGKIVDVLVRRELGAEASGERLQALGQVGTLAEQTLAVLKDDEELQALAKEAKTWVNDEHAKVAAIGADEATLRALFPPLHSRSKKLSVALLEGSEVFFSFDAAGNCDGIYAVGPVGRRALHSPSWPADRILSQAVGHPATVKHPEKTGASSVTWKEGGVKVVARWRDEHLMELRIGDASP